ncbi:MAG: type I DNA topoisomerase [Calditrichaeota bacterium]|nr:type I DNA topoisomerase [Calditrichota bacterium]
MAKKSLVVVESPAKAKTINKYLGSGFEVAASVGHIIDLPKTKLGVSIEEGFKPQYVRIRGKEKIIKDLQNKAQKSEKVYIATDPDREGEAIAYHISSILNKDESDIYRVEFNEITRGAVDEAMKHPRSIDMNRVYSQQARRVLDRIVGYKISPFLWEVIYRGLSAGRVQSVALRLICEREEEIRNFTPEEFWNIFALVKAEEYDPFRVKLVKFNNKKIKIHNQKEAEEHLAALRSEQFGIASVQRKEVKRQPAPPFTTSTMQQVASRRLRMSTKRIMGIAQSLYEGVEIPGQGSVGLITYMRTDSTRISPVAIDAVREFIQGNLGEEFVPDRPRHFKTKKSAQDAHEAIRPTYLSPEFSPEALKDKLTADQFRLYDLIWKRFVACQMTPAVFEKTTVEVSGGKYIFQAEGEVMKFPGFMKVYKEELGENNNEDRSAIPANLKEGIPCQLKELIPEQNFTKPPARYTESTLVKELDRLGIGRPSTYAQIVSTILQRKYVERKEQKLFATELGETVNKILVKGFPDLFNVSFTAKMEEKLDEIANNGASYEQVMTEFYNPLMTSLERIQKEKEELKSLVVQETEQKCEKCGRPMVIRWGRNGRFLACSGFPECRNTKPLEEDQQQPEETGEICDICGSPMIIKRGRYGAFLACSNYPKCKNTRPLSTGISCPREDCDGKIVERRTKKGRVFYGCSNYPKCDFVSWDKPVNKECPQCGNRYMVEKNLKSKGLILRCPECKYEESA